LWSEYEYEFIFIKLFIYIKYPMQVLQVVQ